MKLLPWVDIETSGLDSDTCKMLEAGIVITDEHLAPQDKVSWVIDVDLDTTPMDAIVLDMHTKSGLLLDIQGGLCWPLSRVEGFLTAAMEAWFPDYVKKPPPLCGSSVGFDRRFLEHYMPHLAKMFHYRNIDVSTLKELARVMSPTVFKGRPADESKKAHRVVPDCLASIAELRYYIDAGFIRPDYLDQED